MLRPVLLLTLLVLLLVLSAVAHAKDDWSMVRTANFTLVGNAPSADLRRVADRLEEFRETLRSLAPSLNFRSKVPVNVVVFATDAEYRPFKPKRADGKIDQDVAGYFQSGEDANYITLSAGGDDESFQTIFHEYVHSIVSDTFGRIDIPPWLNEGLAEYYQTVLIENDAKAVVGLPRQPYLKMLEQGPLIPLEQMVRITNAQLREMDVSRRRLFYGESWALVHHIAQSQRPERLDALITSLTSGVAAEKAFQDAVAVPYRQIDQELKNYVSRDLFSTKERLLTTGKNSSADAPRSITTAEAEAYLGDLLYHMQRDDEAEIHIQAALALDARSPVANKALGLLRLNQRKFIEARAALETALKNGLESATVSFRFAELISREDIDEFGYVFRFKKENVDRMRAALRKAVALNPSYVDAYERLAFIDLVNGEELDDAISMLTTARKLAPNDVRLPARMTEIYIRQHRYDEAQKIAEEMAAASSPEFRQRGVAILKNIQDIKASERDAAAVVKTLMSTPIDIRPQQVAPRVEERPPTDAELAKIDAENELRGVNTSLRTPNAGEERVIGRVTRIGCRGLAITYSVKTPKSDLILASPDFRSVRVAIYRRNTTRVRLDCGESFSSYNSVITYRPAALATQSGTLISIEFVADDFHFLTEEESRFPPPRIFQVPTSETPPQAPGPNAPTVLSNLGGRVSSRDEMLAAMRSQLRKAGDGETREMGYLRSIDCDELGATYRFATTAGEILLRPGRSDSVPVRLFTPDLAALSLTCSTRSIEYPAVFIYRKNANPAGILLSIEFVPKSFVLNP